MKSDHWVLTAPGGGELFGENSLKIINAEQLNRFGEM